MLRPGRKLSKITGISKHVFRNMNDFFFWLFVFSDVISCKQAFKYHFCLIFFLTSDAYPVKFIFFLMSDAKIDSNNKLRLFPSTEEKTKGQFEISLEANQVNYSMHKLMVS